jgi:hypothetical protein
MPIIKRRIPPPIRNASIVIPKSWRMMPPTRAKATRMMRAYRHDSIATFNFASYSSEVVRDTKVRVAPRGLTMIRIEERERRANVTISPAIMGGVPFEGKSVCLTDLGEGYHLQYPGR